VNSGERASGAQQIVAAEKRPVAKRAPDEPAVDILADIVALFVDQLIAFAERFRQFILGHF
jgi:hypothetical protein